MGSIKTLSRENLERINYDITGKINAGDEALEAKIQETKEALATEKAERQTEDSRIEGLVEAEKERAITKEAELQASITAEEEARTAGDNELDAKISQETSDRINADEQLQSVINQEIDDRKAADSQLDEKIDQETADRIVDVEEEQERASAREDAIEQSLNTEITRSTTKDAELEASITAETARAESKESALEAAISAEETARTDADKALEDAYKAADEQIIAGYESAIDSVKEEYIAADTRDLAVAKAYADNVFTERIADYRSAAQQDAIDETFAEKANTYTKAEVDSLLEGSGKVQDVQVNGESVLEDGIATIALKTINGSAITGEGDLEVGVSPEEKALIDTIPSKADKSEVSSISSVVSETQVLLRREVEAREGLSDFVGDTPLTTVAQTVTGAIEELKAGGASVKVDNKTIEIGSDGLHIKNEGVTKGKINSEAGVVFEDDVQTLTNKTIDATKNTIKNLPAVSIKAIDTSALTTTDDTHVPSSKLVKNYADTKVSIPSSRANKILGWNESGNMKLFSYQKVYEHFCAIKRNASTDDTSYITFSVRNYDSTMTYAKLCKWLYNNGFTAKNVCYPAAGLAAANTIYVASSSGGANTTSFSATSCINGLFSADGSSLSYLYRAGTTVSLESGRFKSIKTISRGYELTD